MRDQPIQSRDRDYAIQVAQHPDGWRWSVGPTAAGCAPSQMVASRCANMTLGLIAALDRAAARRA